MQPILWQSEAMILPAWHVFFVIAALLSYQLLFYLRRSHHPELAANQLSWVFACGYVGGYVGARLWPLFFEDTAESPVQFVDYFAALGSLGPMTFYGGFFGCCLAVVSCLSLCRLNWRVICDLSVPAGLLGLAVGRVGCFLNGDDYGIAVAGGRDLPPWWAVADPPVWRVPVQLIESGGALAIVLACVLGFKRLQQAGGFGRVGLFGLQMYALLRFSDEFLRDDPRGFLLIDWLSPAQLISVCVFFAIGGIVVATAKQRES